MKKNKICVYTCITGNYDNLKEIKTSEKGIDYYCFTNNNNIKSKTWNVIYIEDEILSNIQLARKIKILGHPIINEKYDILLWMDGAVVFRKNIVDFINCYLQEDTNFVGFKHGERNNIKDEAISCYRFYKETKENVENIIDFYKKENYPDDNGLIESTVFIKRSRNKIVQDTMNLWFNMIMKFTTRDQLSFNYCIYKTGLKVKWIKEKVFANEWFEWEDHVSKSKYKIGDPKIEKYKLYFGDKTNYVYKNDVQGEYVIENDKYVIKTIVPNNVCEFTINLCDYSLISITKIFINGIECKNAKYMECIDYKKEKVFYNYQGSVKILKKLKKGDKINIEIEFSLLNDYDKYDIINYLIEEKKEYQEKGMQLLHETSKIQEKYNLIVNSKGWKLLEKLRKIKPGR